MDIYKQKQYFNEPVWNEISPLQSITRYIYKFVITYRVTMILVISYFNATYGKRWLQVGEAKKGRFRTAGHELQYVKQTN